MKILTIITIALLSIVSCKKNISIIPPKPECPIIVLTQDVPDFEISPILVDSLQIINHCLTISLGFSGCDPNHDIGLLTKGGILESAPPQINLILKDYTEQDCLAYFTKTLSYDLGTIDDLIKDEESIWINIRGTNKRILYIK